MDCKHPYLGASPDGLLHDNTLVEIKSCFTARVLAVKEEVAQKRIKFLKKKDGRPSPSRTHNQWYQVQGQLHIV